MKKEKIILGDRVKSKLNGFEGIAVCRTEFINGCIQYGVLPKLKKTDKLTADEGEVCIDEYSLTVVKKRAVESMEYDREDPIEENDEDEEDYTGGPNSIVNRRNF
jgi:hypothetical protein|tara:strand:+ start:273 stop:587 length:315 start_codon:yes stop_codon:yes gene_type:complete